MTLGTAAAEAEEADVHEAADATDSNSSGSSDTDVDTDSSGEEANDTAVIDASSLAGGQDHIADEPTQSADDDTEDRRVREMRPGDLTRISANWQVYRSRSRSPSSSSSEYSSL